MFKESIREAHSKISPYIHNTQVLTSSLLNEALTMSIYFKCENFQKMGAFKMRGAVNAIMQLSNVQKTKGVVTHSSGNFAQALSLAAKSLGVDAYIVMPTSAPLVKKNAVKAYGGKIIECKPALKARETTAYQVQNEKGVTFIHPSNNIDVILGQATASKEFLESQPDLDYILYQLAAVDR